MSHMELAAIAAAAAQAGEVTPPFDFAAAFVPTTVFARFPLLAQAN